MLPALSVLLALQILMAPMLMTGCSPAAGSSTGTSSGQTGLLTAAATLTAVATTATPATDSPTTAASTATTTATAAATAATAPSATATAATAATTAAGTTSAGDGKVVLAEGFYYIRLDDELKARITGLSYPADDTGCKITYDDLRYIRLLHYDFTGNVHEGELIVNARLADEVMEIFYELYLARYPLASVILVDEFGEAANDDLSMAANNTSAFNYRFVSGTTTLSRHSYGAAIDINPLYNPYIVGDKVSPENAAAYVDRTQDFPGKIDHDDLCYQLFTEYGWSWGGDWSGDKDYQHFSKKLN